MRSAALGLTLALAAAGPAIAQTPPETAIVRTFNLTTQFTPPPWSTAENIGDTSEISRRQGQSANNTQVFLLEFVPKGESFEAWTELYAVMAETPLLDDVKGYRDGMGQAYKSACRGAAMNPIVEAPRAHLFVLYCPAYVGDPATGEIAVMAFRWQDGTLVKNYYHKRGPAFTLDDAASHPLSIDDINAVIERLAEFQVAPAAE